MGNEEFFKQYQTKEWYDISKRIKARDHNTCQMCGCNDKPLSVHHLRYGENGSIYDVPDSALITLCEDCHQKQHLAKKDILSTIDDFRWIGYTDYEISLILRKLLYNNIGSTEEVYLKKLNKWRLQITENGEE